jgi:hypothetical protein
MIQVKILGQEMVQVIQNLENETELVPGKPAVLRIYLEYGKLPRDTELDVQLEIANKGPSGQPAIIPGRVRLSANGLSAIGPQRKPYRSSLNFRIPGDLVSEPMLLGLTEVTPDTNVDKSLFKPNLKFLPGELTLNLRTIGIRFCEDNSFLTGSKTPKSAGRRGLNKTYQPDIRSIREFESLANRCLPVSTLNASHITIDAPRHFKPPFPVSPDTEQSRDRNDQIQIERITALHAFLMAVRSMDVERGSFDDTYYSAMLGGPTGNLRGEASEVAVQNDDQYAGNVAVSLADAEGYYGIHELGHLLGMLHPGNPAIVADDNGRKRSDIYVGQEKEDKTDNINGLLNDRPPGSPNAGDPLNDIDEKLRFVGLDTGDNTHSIQVKHYSDYFDIMTYRYNLWISNYTFAKLVDKLSRGFKPAATSTQPVVRVIGQYSKNSSPGKKLLYLLPVSKLLPDERHVATYLPASPGAEVELEVKFKNDPEPVYLEVERRKKPQHTGEATVAPEHYSDWGVFQLDLEPMEGKEFEWIKLNEHQYGEPDAVEPDLLEAINNLKVERSAFDNDHGFKIRLSEIPTDCHFVVAVRNDESGYSWQTVAVESIQENEVRKEAASGSTEVYIDKYAIEYQAGSGKHKEWKNLKVNVKLIRGFDSEEKEYLLQQ